MSNKYLIVIAGPTAVGKTETTIWLANHFKTEIVSADSRQFYQELEIGTAKPTQIELSRAKHHFINSHSIHDHFTVGDYERDGLIKLEELFQNHQIVFLTGGSGLYIQAICDGLDDIPKATSELREQLNNLSLDELQQKVKSCDPSYFEIVDTNNPHRLVRALEVFETTGNTYSSYRNQSKVKRPFEIIKIMLNRDRDELYERIDLRVDQMIDTGLFEEAKTLLPYKTHGALQTVGYKEIFGFLENDYDRNEAIRLLKRNSRRYAKRQLTWFRKDPEYTWLHPSDLDGIKQTINSKII